MAVVSLAPRALHLGGGTAGNAAMTLPPPTGHIDREDFGLYRIQGPCWVKEKALPNPLPLRRRVRLYEQRSGRFIRETWSDAVTGEYRFDHIRGGDGTTYFIVAYDHTGHHRGVIADNLTPQPMP